MYRKLQHNFDIIQYLLKDISAEQLAWRNPKDSLTLDEIIERLNRLEQWHHASLRLHPIKIPTLCFAPFGVDAISRKVAHCPCNFETYVDSRRHTLAMLKDIPEPYFQMRHPRFGLLTLADLIPKIDAYDQAHIRQIESIIRCMPLNPLLIRAKCEIDSYHRRYQFHLQQAQSVLDIGVGTGLALNHIMQNHPQIRFAGVDVRDLRLPEINIPLQIYNGHTLPFADNQFDVSLLFYVLHHCQNPERVLDEAVRVTRQKIVLIEEFDRPDADEISLDLTERHGHRAIGLPSDMPYQLFSKPEFEMMLSAHGLVQLDQQRLPSRTTRPVEKFLYVTQLATT